jgi:hypothetical protein
MTRNCPRFCGGNGALPVLRKAATSPELCEGAFDDPPARQTISGFHDAILTPALTLSGGAYRVADSKGFNLVYISGENEEVRRSILNLPTGGKAKALAKAIALLPELMTDKPKGSPRMSTEGLEFLRQWIERNVSEEVKQSGDPESLAIKLAARAIYDANLRGLRLDDFEPEFGTAEVLIREALESSEGTTGD